MVVPLSGPGPTMAKESEQETGMIQCVASSRDALMTMEFPSSGGAVQGQYLVNFTAHDTSALYDEDGSWDYYDEDRTVSMQVQFSGVYSGGEEGTFSGLRVTGTAAVDIDNLFDNRFDRSYGAEMDSPATATWGPGNSLTLTGIQGEFEPVSVNASDIPNTEWLAPEGFGFSDPTMICTPAQRAQTPQDVACFITTDPPELGDRDVAFQANVTVTGFDPDADLTYLWSFGAIGQGDVVAEGQNPTITWRNTMFSPGYYTLGAIVTDGGFVALCDQHFTIGDMPPNNPPECLDVIVVPLPPPAGSPVLGARVVARDADGDPLDYSFGLSRGFGTEISSPGPWYPDTYVFGVPGGLQPGPYTVSVLVSDGNFLTWCTFHFVVPDFVGGESAECGPVGIMYLDDYDVEMNQLAIDASIEAALAEGGPEYSVIVSHRQALIDKFGQEGFEQIDALLNDMRSIAETCPFVLIIGDHDVVPYAVLPNPASDGDVLFTDDIYGDTDHDDLLVPDIPIARIPDGNSLDMLVTQLSPSSVPAGGNFTVANTEWRYTDLVTGQIFGPDRVLLWSLPTRHTDFDASQVNMRHTYFTLHGSPWMGTAWFGEGDIYPVALTVAEANSTGIVLGSACFGARTFGRTPDNSIPLAFLDSGARAFVGTRSTIWLPLGPDLLAREAALFQNAFWAAFTGGEAPLAAFMEAKEQLAAKARSRSATPTELKMLHDFVYYGKP
jgi:hypothetical protein